MRDLINSFFALLIPVDASINSAPGWKDAAAFQFVTIGDSGELGLGLSLTGSAIIPYANDPRNAFVAMVGDNFYPGGLVDVNDPTFTEVFERTFVGSQTIFHPVLGDADYGDDNKVGSLNAQVHASTRWRHNQWYMPALYYRRIVDHGGVRLCAVFIDTQSLVLIPGIAHRKPSEWKVLARQIEWLKETLSDTKCKNSDFIIVFGHHAVKSGGKKARKGPSKKVADILVPIFEEYHIDAYFAGHDHDLQVVKKDVPETLCNGTTEHCMVYIVSGAASRLRPHPEILPIDGYKRWGDVETYGFAVTYLFKEHMITEMISSATGKTLNSDVTPSHRRMRQER